MLSITPTAADTIRDIALATPDVTGVRLSASTGVSLNGSGPSQLLTVEPASVPEEADEVIEAEGVQVFIEPSLRPYLDDKVLDVDVDGEQATFLLAPQD